MWSNFIINFFSLIYSIFNLKYDNGLVDAANAILEDTTREDIRLYVGYDDGGYFEYKGIKSFIDPRAEVFVKKNNKKADIMKEYYDVIKGYKEVKIFIEKYQFTHFAVFPDDAIDKYLKENSQKYELIFEQPYEFDKTQIYMKIYKNIEG